MPRDAHGSFIAASELPKGCQPPYRVATVWTGEHRGWHIIVSKLPDDPLPHVVASGVNPNTGSHEAHSTRQAGATPGTVKAWVDSLIATTAAGEAA